jgi:hypothetical protein
MSSAEAMLTAILETEDPYVMRGILMRAIEKLDDLLDVLPTSIDVEIPAPPTLRSGHSPA